MVYLMYTPRPPLDVFVDRFWYYEGYNPAHERERVLPDGSMEIVLNLDETGSYNDPESSIICGAHSSFFTIYPSYESPLLGIHFRPGGAFPFFNVPSDELHNEVMSLDRLWGSGAIDLRDRLLQCGKPGEMFDILEKTLLAQVSHTLIRHPAVCYALKEFKGLSQTKTITEVTDQIGLSSRRFIELFKKEVGMTPKRFDRTCRFQRVLKLIPEKDDIDWMDIAMRCGYYDHAHFIHDFQAFSGFTPSDYLSRRTEHQNHVPI